jgi:hypothetical protein
MVPKKLKIKTISMKQNTSLYQAKVHSENNFFQFSLRPVSARIIFSILAETGLSENKTGFFLAVYNSVFSKKYFFGFSNIAFLAETGLTGTSSYILHVEYVAFFAHEILGTRFFVYYGDNMTFKFDKILDFRGREARILYIMCNGDSLKF